MASLLFSFLPLLLLVGVFIWFARRGRKQMGGIMSIGKSKAKLYDEERPTTRFADIAGYEGSKAEVMEVVDFLKHPQRYAQAGAVGPKGILMVGPPGTGKTLMAKAVAGEAGVPFFALSGSSFVEMFVGVGASRVRDLFSDARKHAPSIIFIDEIDAIGGRRGPGGFGSNDEREQTLNQLLSDMDGFEPGASVVVMGATNRAEILDSALLRPGRFDRTVDIPLPNQKERTAILAIHGRGKSLAPDVDLAAVSRGTPGFSGADLANLVNEAAINAVRDHRAVLSAADFAAARDRLLIGQRDASNALLPEEKNSVAVHEAGHALVAVLSEHADPVAKVTILPRGAALGVTEQLPEFERHLYRQSYLTDTLAVRLGGRAAEIIVLGEPSTGASNDLAGATDLATRMVREWGFSTEVGPIGYGPEGPSRDNPFAGRPYAEETQRAIDREVATLLREAETRATTLLRDEPGQARPGRRSPARTRDHRRLGPDGHRRDAGTPRRARNDLGTPGGGDDPRRDGARRDQRGQREGRAGQLSSRAGLGYRDPGVGVRVRDGTGAGRAEPEGTGTGVPARVGEGTGPGAKVREGTGPGIEVREGTGRGIEVRDGEGVAEPGPGVLRDTAESSPARAGWPPPPAARARPVPPASRAATGTPSQAIARLLGVLI